jgi:hypothetical protein
LLKQYAFEPFIHPRESAPNLLVVAVVHDRMPNEQPAIAVSPENF